MYRKTSVVLTFLNSNLVVVHSRINCLCDSKIHQCNVMKKVPNQLLAARESLIKIGSGLAVQNQVTVSTFIQYVRHLLEKNY